MRFEDWHEDYYGVPYNATTPPELKPTPPPPRRTAAANYASQMAVNPLSMPFSLPRPSADYSPIGRPVYNAMRGVEDFFSKKLALPPNRPLPSPPGITSSEKELTPGSIENDLAALGKNSIGALSKFGANTLAYFKPKATTNPSFSPMPGTTTPSFSPMPGERPALQMPGVSSAVRRAGDWWNRTGYQEPPNFRSMPTWNSGPEQTPYPKPPFLNFSNWMDTGERGPVPLQWYRPGGYPAPANPQMPEAYDARTSGGMLG